MAETLEELYAEKAKCTACKLRAGCTQVVVGTGCLVSPALMIIGEGPTDDDDLEGEPFLGSSGQALRSVLRETKVLNKKNTLLTNVVACRPPKNKFPKDGSAEICIGNWLWKEIELAKPARILLLGSTPLKYVADLDGITKCRGQWYNIRGVRTMATYHPSYVLRQDGQGIMVAREQWTRDINEVANEVKLILDKQKEGKQEPIE